MNKALEANVVSMIGDNKFAKYLMRVYKKKIKRRKKVEEQDESGWFSTRYLRMHLVAIENFNLFF